MTTKLNYLIFSLAALSGIAVRTVMLIFTVDSVSGFIKSEYSVAVIGIIAFLIAAAVVIFLSCSVMKTKKDTTPHINGKPFGIACILMAVAMIYETFFSRLLSYAPVFQVSLQYAFTAASAAALFYIAFCKLTDREFPKIISIAPVFFWAMRLIMIFTEFSTISTISDTVIETAGMCLSLITFLSYAKIECFQPTKHYRFFFGAALTNAYICAIGSIPRIIADVFSFGQSTHLSTVPTTTALAAGIFSLIFAYRLLNEIKE